MRQRTAAARAKQAESRRLHGEAIRGKRKESASRARVGPGRPWTAEDDRALSFVWGSVSLRSLCRRLGRTMAGLRNRSVFLELPVLAQGKYALNVMARETGYDARRLLTATDHLGIKPRRALTLRGPTTGTRGRPWAFTDQQRAQIVAFLATVPDGRKLYGKDTHRARTTGWGNGGKAEACEGCGSRKKPYHSRNRCFKCYRAFWWAGRKKKSPQERKAA